MNQFYNKSYQKKKKIQGIIFIAAIVILLAGAGLFVIKYRQSAGLPIPGEVETEITTSAKASAFEDAVGTAGDETSTAADNGTYEDEEDTGGNIGDGLPDETLKRLKDATVFIRVGTGNNRSTGSGFLYLTGNGSGYIVTNAHVAAPEGKQASNIEVVFYSGTALEENHNAHLLAHDMDKDLAFLKIEGHRFPIPLNDGRNVTLKETMPVHIFGFPFGRDLAMVGKENPEVTVSSGSVSSIRHNEAGDLSYVQLTGDINPGNSGGPIVSAKGRLIGVAVAKLKGTQIGLAIPQKTLREFFAGGVADTAVTKEMLAKDKTKVTIKLQVMDPLKKLKRLGVVLMPEAAVPVPLPRTEKGTFAMIGDSLEDYKKCTLNNREAQISFTLKGEPKSSENFYYQVGYMDADNVVHFMEPKTLQLAFREGDGSHDAASSSSSDSTAPAPTKKAPPVELPKLKAVKIAQTPSTISNCCPGGGGGHLVVFFKHIKKLGIFSFAEQKFTHYLPVPSAETIYTAGRDHVVAVDPGNGIVMRYSLHTGERELTKRIPFTGVVQRVALGSNSNGPLLVRWATGTSALDRATYDLVNLHTLSKIKLTKPMQARNSCYRDNVHLRCSADGSIVGVWATSHSPTGLGCIHILDSHMESRYEHDSVGPVLPDAAGRYLYTGAGYYSNDLKLVSQDLKKSGQILLPALEGPYFLGLGSSKSDSYYDRAFDVINIYLAGDSAPLFTTQLDQGVTGVISNKASRESVEEDYTIDRRFYFHPSSGMLAVLPDAGDKIVLVPLDVLGSMKKSGIDYLFVTSQPPTAAQSGSPYVYQVKVMSKAGGVKYKLESGPQGMTISSRGLISWDPGFRSPGNLAVILMITDDSGQEIFHTYNIKVQ